MLQLKTVGSLTTSSADISKGKNTGEALTDSRPQSMGEEIANAIIHGIATALAIAAIPILVVDALDVGALGIVSASVFGASLFLLYLASTLLHALPNGKAKAVFNVLDHCAIYLLIAGTYTPLLLVSLGGSLGWAMFGVIWGMALIGVIYKSVWGNQHPMLSNVWYLVMGWIILVVIKPLLAALPAEGVRWLLGGGLAYTVGVVFYVADSRWKYAHTVWHLFVLVGSLCHFFAILFHVL